MNTIKIKRLSEIPKNFTGIAARSNGNKAWYKEGKLHREDGPAIDAANGSKEWWVEGKLHREDGPACEYPNGYKEWWFRDKRHRLDGPAVEYSDGYKEWWFEGKHYLPINLKDQVVLDSYQGKYGIIWYKLLNKDQILEYPDIPGLITK